MKRGVARTPNPLLRAAREAAGRSQQQLADLAGVSRGTIANAENGASSPRGVVAERLAAVLETTPEALGLSVPDEHPLARSRREAGVTQQELAAYCGVTRRAIIDLEAGRGNPKPVLLGKLVERFGRPPGELGFAATDTHPLTAARAAYELTHTELAARVGVHTNVVVDAETRRKIPRAGTVVSLADFFQTTPEALGLPTPADTWRVAARKSEMQYWIPVGQGLLVRVPPPVPAMREVPVLPPHLAGRGVQAAYLHASLAGFPQGVVAGARAADRAGEEWTNGRGADHIAEPLVQQDPSGNPAAAVDADGRAKSVGEVRVPTPQQWLRPLPGAAQVAEEMEDTRRRAFPNVPPTGAPIPSAAVSAPPSSGSRSGGGNRAQAVFRERYTLALRSGYLRGWALVMAGWTLHAAARNPRIAAPGVDPAACRAAATSLARELPRMPAPSPRTPASQPVHASTNLSRPRLGTSVTSVPASAGTQPQATARAFGRGSGAPGLSMSRESRLG